jgi:hypothetical protein
MYQLTKNTKPVAEKHEKRSIDQLTTTQTGKCPVTNNKIGKMNRLKESIY